MTPLPPLERLQAVEVQPDDVIVATSPNVITATSIDAIRRAFPRNKILVVEGGATIEVQRPAPQWVDP